MVAADWGKLPPPPVPDSDALQAREELVMDRGMSITRRIMFLKKWPLMAPAIALAAALAVLAIAGPVRAADTLITCTNPASGASWEVRIDYAGATVDSNPARISDAAIVWRDTGGSNYTLERQSGNLTVVVPSSTGGYFLYDRCGPKKSG